MKSWTQLSDFHFQFLPRSKHLLISWLQSPSTVILEPKNIKSIIVSIVFPSTFHEVMGPDVIILFFECWVLSQLFTLLFHFHQEALSSFSLSSLRVVSSAYLKLFIFLPAILIPARASSSPAFRMMYSAISWISKVTIHSLDVLLSQFGTSSLFHVQF